MRRAVRDQVREGADLIKIMANHDRQELTDDEMEAVIDEAHRNGLPITAHATNNEAISRVVKFGIDCVEHGGSMTDETIQLLLDRGVPIVTTFAPLLMQAKPEVARQYNIPEIAAASQTWSRQPRQACLSPLALTLAALPCLTAPSCQR
jgi:imidazolonepropionase-like amidohydrolase